MNCRLRIAALASSAVALALGCSSSSLSGKGNSGNCTDNGAVAGDAGMLRSFRPPTNPGAQGLVFTVSGEALALGGYAFPAAAADSLAFVDGWAMHFDRLLVTLDNITLSQNPDLNPGDQSQTGPVVVQVKGPWAIDLHQGGPLEGKGGSDEQSFPIATLIGQNGDGCSSLDLAQRYALGFDVISATSEAMNVNLDATAQSDYAEMIEQRYSALYVGTATWQAGDAGVACTPENPEFAQLPKSVNFRLGFRTPTTYLNCQNPDNDPAKPLNANEEHLRGVQPISNKAVTAQLTIHTDHPFWDSPMHDSPLHFDQIAARYVGVNNTPTARVEDFAGVDFTHFTDPAGNPLPWRNCLGSLYTPPDSFTMHFNPAGHALADYEAFMVYNESTSGHLNSDGLCSVKRNFASAN
jgi:hypothetical protein